MVIKAHTCFNRLDLPSGIVTIEDMSNILLAIVDETQIRFDFE